MEQTTYSRKERGKSLITQEEWHRFSQTLEVSIEDIKEDNAQAKNENCTFNDNSVGIQNISIPQEVLDIILRYNKKLEDEIKQLKERL